MFIKKNRIGINQDDKLLGWTKGETEAHFKEHLRENDLVVAVTTLQNDCLDRTTYEFARVENITDEDYDNHIWQRYIHLYAEVGSYKGSVFKFNGVAIQGTRFENGRSVHSTSDAQLIPYNEGLAKLLKQKRKVRVKKLKAAILYEKEWELEHNEEVIRDDEVLKLIDPSGKRRVKYSYEDAWLLFVAVVIVVAFIAN